MESTHIQHVCKFGMKTKECRYLVLGARGFECLKIAPGGPELVAARVKKGRVVGTGDYCEGKR